jgi:WD40 repeat protein
MPSLPWSQSLCISPKENYVVVGFDNATVRFFKTTMSEEPREDHLHMRYHQDCKACPSVDTLSFSNDGLVLLASTRSPKTGTVQLYSWHFPFEEFQELIPCRYPIPLHESEDNGVSSAIFRPGTAGEENLICVTTWTMSGVPVLFQPSDGLRSEIRTDPAGHQGKLGNRIQCASFSPSGRELAIVNNKGHLYLISSLNSRPLELRRIATSKELTIKSDSFAIAFMTVADDDSIVLAWTDPSKCMAYIKKVPVKYNVSPMKLSRFGLANL